MSITGRIFLRHTAAGAAVAVTAPAVAAEPEMSPRERAIWHMEELERLVLADGATAVTIIVCGHDYDGITDLSHGKSMGLHPGGKRTSSGGMFAADMTGGARHG